MKRLILLFPLFLLFLSFCNKEDNQEEPPSPPPPAKNAVDLLPKDNEISGWTKSGQLRTASTPDELTAIINGEAVPYINNNFKEAVFQNYQGIIGGNNVTLEVRIFDMRDTINARKVYKDVANGQETPWVNNHPGVEARIDESGLFSYAIDFWEDKFFVRTVIQEKSSASLDIAKTFSLNISAAIKE